MNQSEKEKIVAIMKENCLLAFLATCDGDQPQVRPVSPIIEDDMSIWVTTFANSKKVKQIKQNSKISLAFVQYPSGDKTATVTGDAEIVEPVEAKKRVWNLATFNLTEHFPNGPESEEFCLLRINPKKIEWWDSWASGRKIYVPSQA
ncbi:MAG: pyridoxamine 5'-phosphate oxidase family protein [Euryarchaeota archaeon]|nr:pyridoxamine 5'-phosphate oxidase family protein [Euryarchaeota archaeon]